MSKIEILQVRLDALYAGSRVTPIVINKEAVPFKKGIIFVWWNEKLRMGYSYVGIIANMSIKKGIDPLNPEFLKKNLPNPKGIEK